MPEHEPAAAIHPGSPGASSERWLAIAEEEFIPDDSGGRVESLNMIRAAASAGIRLHIIVPGLTEQGAVAHCEALPDSVVLQGIPRRAGLKSHLSTEPFIFVSRPLPKALPDRLRREHQLDPFTAVLSVSFRVAHLGDALAARLGLPHLVRPHNVESQYFEQLARSSTVARKLPYLAEAWKLRRAERRIHALPPVTAFADIGERDAQWRAGQTQRPVIHVPPFVPPVPSFTNLPLTGSAIGNRILFVGALDNGNNVGGVRWFLQTCWPAVKDDNPTATFEVVGRRAPTSLVAELRAMGAQVTDDAPEVASHLAAADIFVNPVQQGAGVNIKMIEAMSAGLPVVATSVGARGMHWRDGHELLIADAANDFATAVGRLTDDEQLRRRLGTAGNSFVREELDWARQIDDMLAALSAERSTGLPPA